MDQSRIGTGNVSLKTSLSHMHFKDNSRAATAGTVDRRGGIGHAGVVEA